MGMSRQDYAAFMNSMGLLADTAQNLQAQRYQAELLKRKDAELEQQQTLKQVQSAVEVWKNAKNPDTKAAIASNILVPSMRKLYPDMPQDQFDLVSKAFANPDNKSVAKYMDYVRTGLEDMNKGLIKPEELWSNVGLRHAELAETEMSPEQWKVANDNRDEVKRQVGLSLLKPQADGTVNRERQAYGYSLLGQNDEVSKLYNPSEQKEKRLYSTEQGYLPAEQAVGLKPYREPKSGNGGGNSGSSTREKELKNKEGQINAYLSKARKERDKVSQILQKGKRLNQASKDLLNQKYSGWEANIAQAEETLSMLQNGEISPGQVNMGAGVQKTGSGNRDKVIAELKKNGYPVTESNISALLKQMGN